MLIFEMYVYIYIYLESYIHILPILFLRCGKGTSFSKLSWREAVHPNVCCVLQYLLHGYWIPSLVKLWKRSAYFFELSLLCTPPKLAWNLTIPPWKRRNISQPPIFGFHLIFRGCTGTPVFFARGVAKLQSDKDVHELPAADLVAGCDGVNSATGRASLARRDGTVRLLERNWIL